MSEIIDQSFLDYYCDPQPIIQIVQFPNIFSTDTNVLINGGQYGEEDTVNDLIENNPQFFFMKGLSGINTLSTIVNCSSKDLIISVTRIVNEVPTTITSIAAFIGGRPPVHR